MKRYVKEFAADINKRTNGLLEDSIEIILHAVESGMITNFEAITELVNLIRM